MALGGGAVAQSMVLWGGSMAQFLPPLAVMSLAASGGAALAGLVLADAFGRAGRWGVVVSAIAWCMATALGACVGAAFFALESGLNPATFIPNAIFGAAPLGLIAVADGIATSPAVAAVWALAGCAMHWCARVERAYLKFRLSLI